MLLFFGGRNGLAKEPSWMAKGDQPGALMGSWMHRLGDVNQDGYDDVLVGGNTWDGAQKLDCGQARLYFGGPNGPGDKPAWTFEGAGTNSHLTTEVGGAGDVNGDGYPDAIVGEHLYSDTKHPERGRVPCSWADPTGLQFDTRLGGVRPGRVCALRLPRHRHRRHEPRRLRRHRDRGLRNTPTGSACTSA